MAAVTDLARGLRILPGPVAMKCSAAERLGIGGC